MTATSSLLPRARVLVLLAPLLLLAACGSAEEPPRGPEFATAPLPHGGTFRGVEDPAAERVEGVLRFSAGSIHDPAGQTGLVEVLADALSFGGPMQYSGSELHDRLRAKGAWLQVSATPEFLSFDFACPPAALESTLEALADLVLHPHYPPEFVDRARVRLLERLAREAVDPAALADQVLLDVAYGPDAPFTRAPTYESVESIERADLLAFHRARLVADRMQVGVTGPLPAPEIVAALERALADLQPAPPGTPQTAPEQPDFRTLERSLLVFVSLPGATRTEIRVGLPGVSIRAADYPVLRVWSDAHGSAAGSPLELATNSIESGLVTQMGAFFRPRWDDPGEFLAYATTTHEDPHRALGRLTMWVNDATLDGEFGAALPDGVISAARTRVGAADARAGQGRALVGRQLDLDAHGLDANFWERNRVQVNETGAARMRMAAAGHAASDHWLIVTVHAPEITPEYPIVGDGEARSAAFAPRGTPAALAVFEQLFAALGGREAWAGLTHLDQQGQVRTQGAVEPVGVRIWRDLEGDRLRLEQLAGDVESQRVVTPEDAWSVTGDREQPISPEVLASVHFREARRLPRVLHDLATLRAMSVRLGADGEGGERLQVLHWGRLRCWIELGEDGRPTRLGYPGTETERQGESEFKVWAAPVGGLVLPKVIEEPTLGRSYLWTSARVNEPFGDALFRR